MSGIGGLSSPDFALMATNLASDTTGDKATFVVPFKCELVRFGATINGTSAHATVAVIDLDQRVTAGSDTSRVNVARLTKSASNQQGKMLYENPTSRVTADEGDQFIVEVSTQNGDACVFDAVVIVRQVPEVAGNNTAMVAA